MHMLLAKKFCEVKFLLISDVFLKYFQSLPCQGKFLLRQDHCAVEACLTATLLM